MDNIIEKAMVRPKWDGYSWEQLKFKGLVARTKLELTKAAVAEQYRQALSMGSEAPRLTTKLGKYMRYATLAMQAYKYGRRVWGMFKSNH